MKYIDAEKLIAEIEKMREINKKAFMAEHITADVFHGRAQAINRLFEFITSLQQEQPEGLHFTPLNRLIQKIPSEKWNDSTNNYAKKLRDCLIKEGYLKDAEVLQGYISYMNGNNVPMATMDEQEQPEEDIWKEIHKYFNPHGMELQFDRSKGNTILRPKQLFNFARHFWNKGYNARKEK